MISFIGAGKVGSALGLYFKQKGFEIGGYYSKTYEHAKRASNLTESKTFTNIIELMNNSSMVWITVSDDQLPRLAIEISLLDIPQHIEAFVHTSGVHSIEVLQPIKDAGFATFCAHPLMAFGDANESLIQLKSAYFSLDKSIEESKNNDDSYLHRFFAKSDNQTLHINPEKKELYHCAASILSNYMVTLLNVSYEMFSEAGMTKTEIKKATAPLLNSTLKNIIENEKMSDALTGPIKRGDKTTIEKHLQALQKYMPDKTMLYKALGNETMAMIKDYDLKETLT